MAKVVDITDKLSFDENPKIKIKGVEYEVNADARTMLEIMGYFQAKTRRGQQLRHTKSCSVKKTVRKSTNCIFPL